MKSEKWSSNWSILTKTQSQSNEFNSLKDLYEKEIRMLRNRVFQQERDIKKIDDYIEKDIPSQFNKVSDDMNAFVEKNNKERDEIIENIQKHTERVIRSSRAANGI